MELKTWRNIKADYSVQELEIRFTFEEERVMKGLSIKNKEFFAKLKLKIFNQKVS